MSRNVALFIADDLHTVRHTQSTVYVCVLRILTTLYQQPIKLRNQAFRTEV
jgi:hypothetical protein